MLLVINNMKILCISDTHTKHNKIPKEWLVPADIIIHAGDISNIGDVQDTENFCKWFSSLDQYEHKIFIAGNHDFNFETEDFRYLETMNIVKSYKNITYLCDEELILYNSEDNNQPIKIYGSPWQPEFHNWAFNLPKGKKLREKWDKIPLDTDILITHGPVHGLLDMAPDGNFCGCEELLDVVTTKLTDLKYHICGHIHCGHGVAYKNNIQFVNASTLNERYEVQYKPIIIEI